MKKMQIICAGLLALSMVANPTIFNNMDNPIVTSAEEVSTYASAVFKNANATVTTTACYADITLYKSGNATVVVVLQRKNIFGNWYDYKDDDPGTTYTNKTTINHSYPYVIGSSGSYRCKYTVTATVNGNTETKTDYSNVLVV